ncbi:cache domain-containing protein [Desulfomarina sp.]
MQFNIRTKLFISYSSTFLLILIAAGMGVYSFVRLTIEDNIESELQQSTNILLNLVETAAEVSLKNYLRATAEKNLEITEFFYQQTLNGELTEEKAKNQVAEIFLHQHIGESGYIYAIDSDGVLQVHPQPSLVGVNISPYDFVTVQKEKKTGYLVYDWQNPGEKHRRGKALYMAYFAPWDWIISVSTYRSEFRQLVKLDDFRKKILAVSFGKTGYSYVMDLKGNLIIHPKLEGHNILEKKDAKGRYFIREICERKKGKIIYPWQNPGDSTAREKLVIFNYIPQFQWIVASSSYLDEFFAPLTTIRKFMLWAMAAALFLLLPLTLVISRTITAPLQELMASFARPPDGDFTARITKPYSGEIGKLASYFNQFMERLENYSNELKKEIQVRARAQKALRQSEEMFSKAFNLSPISILILSYPQGKIISVNDSFTQTTGFRQKNLFDHSLAELPIFDSPKDIHNLLRELTEKNQIRERAITFHTRDNEKRQGLVSADLITLWGDTCVLAVVEDITERQGLQERILDIGENERRKVGQDIHDDLCPHLIGTEVMVKILQKKLEENFPEAVKTTEKIRKLIKDAIRKSRGMARGLSPVFLVNRGFETAIEELVTHTEEVYGLVCTYKRTGDLDFRDSRDSIHLFLIVQEAVSNSVRHARGTTVNIVQKQSENGVLITITDDGIGIRDVTETDGMGLKIMRYRAERIGAELSYLTMDKGGTRVIITLNDNLTIHEEEI